MRKEYFLTELEAIAPKELALPFDNVGLLVGTTRGEINRVLVALDCTDAVAREAVEFGADMVLTHHPLFFTPIKRILPDDPSTKAAFTLIRNDIGLYAMHTNLDAADGGVNDVLCERLGIVDQKAIGDERIARLGRLSRPQSFGEFACGVEEKLDTRVKVCGDTNREIVRVAVLGGSGGGDVRLVSDCGADAFVTGEIKHSQAIEAAELGLCVVSAGHYETEKVVMSTIIPRLQKKDNNVEYKLAQYDKTSLASL